MISVFLESFHHFHEPAQTHRKKSLEWDSTWKTLSSAQLLALSVSKQV